MQVDLIISPFRSDIGVRYRSHQRRSIKNLFLKISQYSQEHILSPAALLKRGTNTGVFLLILRSVSEDLL